MSAYTDPMLIALAKVIAKRFLRQDTEKDFEIFATRMIDDHKMMQFVYQIIDMAQDHRNELVSH